LAAIQAAKVYLVDLNKRFGYKKNKTVIFSVKRNYEKNKMEKEKKNRDRIMKEAFDYNASLPELRDMNRIQLPEHAACDPDEIYRNRVDLFTMNCRLQRVQHPSASFLVGSALYEGFKDMKFVSSHNLLQKFTITG
jgi:hypothetical protein